MDIAKLCNTPTSKARRKAQLKRFVKVYQKERTIWYGEHVLIGALCFVPPDDFLHLYARLMDISPAEKPALEDADCDPCVLIHCIQGISWAPSRMMEPLQKAVGKAVQFLAVTDNQGIFEDKMWNLGSVCDRGSLTLRTKKQTNDIIVALPDKKLLELPTFKDLSAIPRAKSPAGGEQWAHVEQRFYDGYFGVDLPVVEHAPGLLVCDGAERSVEDQLREMLDWSLELSDEELEHVTLDEMDEMDGMDETPVST